MELLIGTIQVHAKLTQYHIFALLLVFSCAVSFLLPRRCSKAASLKTIDEPTSVLPPNGIPLFGHLIGLLRHGSQYFTKLAYVHRNKSLHI